MNPITGTRKVGQYPTSVITGGQCNAWQWRKNAFEAEVSKIQILKIHRVIQGQQA